MKPDLGCCYYEAGRHIGSHRLEFMGLDANGCFDRACEIFASLDLVWDLERVKEDRHRAEERGAGDRTAAA